jgi:hypothetical protein
MEHPIKEELLKVEHPVKEGHLKMEHPVREEHPIFPLLSIIFQLLG